MIQVQDAVRSSFETMGKVFPEGEVREPRLEEVALSDDEKFWIVTVSFSNPDYGAQHDNVAPAKDFNSILAQWSTPRRRVTKKIKVRASDGAFIGIKDQWEP